MFTKLINNTEIFNAVNRRDTTIYEAFLRQVDNGRVGLVDIHGHIFSSKCAIPSLLKVRNSQKYFLHQVVNFFDRTNFLSQPNPLQNILEYADTSLHSMSEILAAWFALYNNYQQDVAVAPLAIDFETPYILKPQISHRMQLMLTASLAQQDENLGKVLPFFGVDPRRENLSTIISDAFEQGFIGAKVYPSLGYLPSHPVLMQEVWPVFEHFGIPTMAHCSNVGIFSHNPLIQLKGLSPNEEGNGFVVLNQEQRFGPFNIPLLKIKRWQYFNDPIHWRPVLEQFPALKVSFSHLGGWGEIKKHLAGKNSWTTEIFDLMRCYKNVYTDISYVSAEKKFNEYFVKFIAAEQGLAQKIMLATDFPLNKLLKDSQKTVNEILTVYADCLAPLGLENVISFLKP